MEIVVRSQRVVSQNDLNIGAYHQAMYMELEEIDEERIKALNQILLQKSRVARSYNKKVAVRSFDMESCVTYQRKKARTWKVGPKLGRAFPNS